MVVAKRKRGREERREGGDFFWGEMAQYIHIAAVSNVVRRMVTNVLLLLDV